MRQLKRGLRYLYLRFIRLRATPNEISLGFALGVFWGMFPLPGVQMAIAILTAALLRANKIAAAAGTWLTNPLTTLPFTTLNFYVGHTVLGRDWIELPTLQGRSFSHFLNLGHEVITSYLMGCLVVGAIAAIASYGLTLPLVIVTQKRLADRRMRRQKHPLPKSHKTGQRHYRL